MSLSKQQPDAEAERGGRRTALSQEWVIERLMREAEGSGEKSSAAARVAALGLLMKHLGMLRPEESPTDAPTFDLSKLTDVQKCAILAGLRLAVGGSARLPAAERTLLPTPESEAGS